MRAGQQQGRAVQAGGKGRIPRGQRRGGEEGHRTLSQLVAVATYRQPGRHGAVGQHHVQPVQCQLSQQPINLALTADKAHGFCQLLHGGQQLPRQRLGHKHRCTHPEGRQGTAGLGTHRCLQFIAQRKHFIGVRQRHTPGFCQLQPPPGGAQQCGPQLFFKQLDLGTDGLWREMQKPGGTCHTAHVSHRPEIAQVLEIHGRNAS